MIDLNIQSTGFMKKLRGFELVSQKQWDKDKMFLNTELKDIILPTRATRLSAGYDIFSPMSWRLEPNEDVQVRLGWKVYMQSDECLFIVPRSGLGFNFYTRLANTTGLIDSDYYNNERNEGHCWIKIRNEGKATLNISKGQAIAQGIFQRYLLADGDDFNDKRQTRNGARDNK